jgi:hypothetical protein
MMHEYKRPRTWSTGELRRQLTVDCVTYCGDLLIGRPNDPAIADVLSYLGTRLGVDRAWMFEYNDDLTRFRNTHEWCARSVTSHVEDLQDTPVSMIAWLHAALLEGKAVMIDDVTTLPAAAKTLKREMLRQGDKSVLSLPVFHAGVLRACIGFDMVKVQRNWSLDDTAVLAGCARMIAAARYRDASIAPASDTEDHSAPLVYIGHQGLNRGITLRQIVGIRSQRNETQVWLDDGTTTLDRRTLSEWRILLPQALYPSIHRTAIVQLNHIASLDKHGGDGTKWVVRMRVIDDDWSVSRSHRKELVERLGLK